MNQITWHDCPYATEKEAYENNFHLSRFPEREKAAAILMETADGRLELFTDLNINGGGCDCCSGGQPWPKRFAWLSAEQLSQLLRRGLST